MNTPEEKVSRIGMVTESGGFGSGPFNPATDHECAGGDPCLTGRDAFTGSQVGGGLGGASATGVAAVVPEVEKGEGGGEGASGGAGGGNGGDSGGGGDHDAGGAGGSY